jgi:hypothetical protein
MALRPRPETLLLLFSMLLFSAGLFKHLSYPLLWQDEAETAMFATRIVAYGFPKVHGERNVVNEFGANVATGVKESLDAYIGTPWAQFYYAVPGILLAGTVEDLYEKTLLLRLPFALTGALGLGVMVLAVVPVFRGNRRRARLFGGLFFLLAALSLSLVLHLREMRYYALLVLLAASIFWVYLRYTVFATLGFRAYAISLTLLLVLVFNTFYPAYLVFAAWVGIDGAVAAWHARGTPTERMRRELPRVAPVLASAVVVGPLLIFYETFKVAAAFSEAFGLTLERYVANVGMLVEHYLRHELLAAAIAGRIAVYVTGALSQRARNEVGAELTRKVAGVLGLFVIIYVAVGCANPLFYERYFVVLSPLVTTIFLLDAFTLMETVPQLVAERRRRAASGATLLALLVIATATVSIRSSDLRGRVEELTHPYRGVLDFVIPFLRDKSPRPEDLVIATNYAAHSYMYYLRSHVIVGLALNNLARDRLLDPDVVIPRRKWPDGSDEVWNFVWRGEYLRISFPVADTEFNNIPALSLTPWLLDRHRFRTAWSSDPKERLRIFVRARRE